MMTAAATVLIMWGALWMMWDKNSTSPLFLEILGGILLIGGWALGW